MLRRKKYFRQRRQKVESKKDLETDQQGDRGQDEA